MWWGMARRGCVGDGLLNLSGPSVMLDRPDGFAQVRDHAKARPDHLASHAAVSARSCKSGAKRPAQSGLGRELPGVRWKGRVDMVRAESKGHLDAVNLEGAPVRLN